jgi:hypothetical protein
MKRYLPLIWGVAGLAGAVMLASAELLAGEPTGGAFERINMSCDGDAECAALPACATKPGCDGGPNTQPWRLVGYGCAGANGQPLFRDEEDEFPASGCAVIEGTQQ